jgi:hypothetical protein
MRNNIRTFEDSLFAMESRARAMADSQPQMSKAENTWEFIATYSGIILGALIAPLFVIAFLWQFIEVPVKFRGLKKLNADWTFIVSAVVKGAYAVTFIFQWDRLMELLGSERACWFAGVYAPGISIICSLYLFSFERRMMALQSGTIIENEPIVEVEKKQELPVGGQQDFKLPQLKVNLYESLPELANNGNGHVKVGRPRLPLPRVIETLAEQHDKTMVGKPKLLPPMWDNLDAGKKAWQDSLLVNAVLESLKENRKIDVWRDLPPPINKDLAKRFMRLLILTKQNRRGDTPLLIKFINEEKFNKESLRRTANYAHLLMNNNPRKKTKEMAKADLRGYIQMGLEISTSNSTPEFDEQKIEV